MQHNALDCGVEYNRLCKWKSFFVYSVSFFDMDAGAFRLLTGCGSAFLRVGGGQPDADALLVDLKAQTAFAIVFC